MLATTYLAQTPQLLRLYTDLSLIRIGKQLLDTVQPTSTFLHPIMLQSQSVRLQLWRHAVGDNHSKLCEEHTVTNSSPDINAAQHAYAEAVTGASFVISLRLKSDIDFMGASHVSVSYIIQHGEIVHMSQISFKAGDEIFNVYGFRAQREGKN